MKREKHVRYVSHWIFTHNYESRIIIINVGFASDK
jgi:hypothetical protein